MATSKTPPLVLVALAVAAWPGAALAQEPPGGPAPGPAQQEPQAPAAPPVVPLAGETAGPATGKEPPPTVFPPPVNRPPRVKRAKPQQTSLGPDPAAVDFGAEADIVSSVGAEKPPAQNRRWTYALRGFLRAPMRIGIGPQAGEEEGSEFHSPPRIVGLTSEEWNYIGVAPPPIGQIQVTVANQRVSGNIIIAGDIFSDSAYPKLNKLGGFSQAWVTLKSPALFGTTGGVALNVGAFSERFGMAGPYQQSSGYYGTYLFGRTHVAGESLTLDVDLSEDLELVVEHGFGAKVEVVPFRKQAPPIAAYLPKQGPVPQGSNFLHHAHIGLLHQDWLRVQGHYLTSWSPNDLIDPLTVDPPKEARLTVFGGEIHTDHAVAGHGYIGYSFADANNILPLSDALQVIHGTNGLVFKENYFGKLPLTVYDPSNQTGTINTQPELNADDSGTVQTILFQYMLRAAPLFGRKGPGLDAALAVFGMFNHLETDKTELNGSTTNAAMQAIAPYKLKQDRLKFGAELQFMPDELFAIGARFDRVMPDGGNEDVAYTAISPRIVLHSNWLSREYVILNYTRYFLGDDALPSPPYDQPAPPVPVTKADENLISLTAMIAF